MIGTFEALFVLLVAVLPGGLYTIAREHRGGAWATQDGVRLLVRLVAVSAGFHALFAPLTYQFYRHLVANGALHHGRPISWIWWPALLLYLVLPATLGDLTARSRGWGPHPSRFRRWFQSAVTVYTAASLEPRAWDAVFSRPGTNGWIRMQLTDGSWRAGPWSHAYAAGYPYDQDLYIPNQCRLNADGEFEMEPDGATPQLTGWGLLIRWSEIRFLEILDDTHTLRGGK